MNKIKNELSEWKSKTRGNDAKIILIDEVLGFYGDN